MGIQNLLPFVKKACRQGNIHEFAGHSIAVDVSCLLHRGLCGCASAVAQGLETDFYVKYVTKYVKLLVSIGCHVILVFDGKPLPAKKDTNDARREKRDFNKRRGEQLLSEGKTSEAHDFFQRSVRITAQVVENTIEAMRSLSMVDILVAPYESDAQLAFLTNAKKAYAVVTEDSDLIAFGCKQSGLPGIGLNKAATFFAKASGSDLRQVLPRLPRYLNMSSIKVKKEFIEDFIRAENTFLYQIVYDPSERRQRPLHDYPRNEDEDDFVGINMTDEGDVDYSYAGEVQASTLAMRLALGNKSDGSSRTDKFVLPDELPNWSIWSDNFKSGEERKLLKDENDRMAKTKCGAFTLSAFIRKGNERTTTENNNVSIEHNGNIAMPNTDVPVSNKSVEDDEDFVSISTIKKKTVKAENVQKRTITEVKICAEKQKRSFGKKIVSIGTSPRGNGAQRNWKCDELLKMYRMGGQASNSNVSPVSSQELFNRNGVKRSGSLVDGEKLKVLEKRSKIGENDTPSIQQSSDVKVSSPEKVETNLHSTSSYFAIRSGVRTSGLSRRITNPCKKLVFNEEKPCTESMDSKTEMPGGKEVDVLPRVSSSSNLVYRVSGLRRVAVKEN